MSESHRDHEKLSNISSSQKHRNSKDENDRYHRKRAHNETENLDTKVYVGNLPTEKVTDEELLDFFKSFGKVSDIRVFKDHLFVQYSRINEAEKLINEGQISLIFKGNKLNVLPARDVRSTSTKSSSSTDRSSKRRTDERTSYQQRFNYQSSRKSFPTQERSTSNTFTDRMGSEADADDRPQRLSTPQLPYTILTGPKNPTDLIDCQIIIVNVRQRSYAEQIESRLESRGLLTSVILLREDYTLVKAIENATRLQCLYGIIAMPMHEERHTASFHILYGQTEEHRNLTLDDGIHIIMTNFLSYKERLHNEEMQSYRPNHDPTVYSESLPTTNDYHSQELINPPVLTLADKLPLSMLLCLLADGRQLTLEEIDRVLVYLLEKKAKMLTLPPGTLPPLPAQYATSTAFNHQTGSSNVSNTRPMSTTDPSSGKSLASSAEVSSTIAEHIRQILSTSLPKSSETNAQQAILNKHSMDKLPDIVKVENPPVSHTQQNGKEMSKEYVSQQVQSTFSYPKSEAVSLVSPSFIYTTPSTSTAGSVSPFGTSCFSSFNSMPSSLALNSTIKAPTSVTVPNFASQPSQYFYQLPSQNLYQSPLNSTTAADTAAAIFQAYAQFNVQPTAAPALLSQPINSQQQQIRK